MTSLDSILLGGVLILSSYCSGLASAQCIDKPDRSFLTRTYIGSYVNDAYGFSVEIPRGSIGRDVNNPLYQKGFTILFDDPDESLSVDADVNSMEWNSAVEAAKGYADFITEDDDRILSTSSENAMLGGRPAVIVERRFLCKGTSTRYAFLLAISLSRDGRFVYALRWEGKLDEMDGGRRLLRSLCSSWHFRKPKS
jgi:hypothetical protein